MQYVTVARDDRVYECFPDICLCASGKLLAIYRESDGHAAREYSRLVTKESVDAGRNWGERRVLAEGMGAQQQGQWWYYNCPRINALPDGRLVANCDAYSYEHLGNEHESGNFYWLSEDEGETWTEPIATAVGGIVPDKVRQVSDGAWLVGTHITSAETGKLVQVVFRSEDQGQSWSQPTTVADDGEFNHCEGSLLELPDGTLIMYMRENSHQGYPGYKCISRDCGKTWEGPCRTLMAGCERPVPGLLKSGNVLVTYRPNMRGGGAGKHNQFAYLESVESALEPEREKQIGRIIMLDHDNSPAPDTGYSGWVQLPDGKILCIYYIKREAPMAWIRGCLFQESELVIEG